MLGPLLARLVLIVFVSPFLIIIGAVAFAIGASEFGGQAGVVAAAIAVGGVLLALDWWLGAVSDVFGRGDIP